MGYGILALNAKTFRFVTDHTIARWDARSALTNIKNEIRMIRPALIQGSVLKQDELVFKNIHGELYRFKYKNNSLLRKVNSENWETLIRGLTAPPFTYLDIHKTVTTQTNSLAYIHLNLKVRHKSEAVQLSEMIYVRN